jgi:hypothetical protein
MMKLRTKETTTNETALAWALFTGGRGGEGHE